MISVIADSLPQEDAVGWAQRIQATAATALRQQELLMAQGEVVKLSDLRVKMEGMSKRANSGNKARLSATTAISSPSGISSPAGTSVGITVKPSVSLSNATSFPSSSSSSSSTGAGAVSGPFSSSSSVFAMSPEARMALGLGFSPVSSSFNSALRPPGSPSIAVAAQAARKLDMAEGIVQSTTTTSLEKQ
jgi:hypothetical protein